MAVRTHISSGSPFEKTIGFSRAIRVGNRVLVSGTAPIEEDGSCSSDVGEQTRRCLQIIEVALRQAGAEMSDVVRTRQYLVDPADGVAVGEVHGEFFGQIRPASTQVAVAALLRPEWRVEIEAEAIINGRSC